MTYDLRLGSCLDPLHGLASLADKSVDVTITDLAAGTAAEHLVCADLLLLGYHAFIAGQNCAYDIAVDINGRLVRVQVKSTRKPHVLPGRAQRPAYMWHVRRTGKGNKRVYGEDDFDMLALVALDSRQIAYLPPSRQRQGRSPIEGKTFAQFPFDKAVLEVCK